MRPALFLIAIITVCLSPLASLTAQDRLNIEQEGRLYNYWDAARDVVIRDEIAYVAAGKSGLRMVDISNPADMSEIGSMDYCDDAIRVAVVGRMAYVLDDGGRIHVINISDPEDPDLAGSSQALRFAQDMVVKRGYAYVAADKFYVLDISDPEEIVIAGWCDTPLNVHSVLLYGDYAYVYTMSFDWGPGRHTIDISDPTNPEIVNDEGGYRGGFILGARGYIPNDYTFTVMEFIDPLDPIELGDCEAEDPLWKVLAVDDFAYCSGSQSFQTFDISDDEAPEQIGNLNTPGRCYGIAVADGFAFVTDQIDNLLAIDVNDPAEPELTAHFGETGKLHDVVVSGDYAYVASQEHGIRIVDISNRRQPEEVEIIETEGKPLGLDIAGDLLYVADGDQGLLIFDVTVPEEFLPIGSFDTPGSCSDVVVSGDYAYLADGYEGGFRIVDVSDPGDPTELGSIQTQEEVWCVDVVGNQAYIGEYYGGFRVIDISDPLEPAETAFVYPWGHTMGVKVSGDYAYMAVWCREFLLAGFDVMDISNPEDPRLVSRIRTDGQPCDISLDSSFVYLTDGDKGLRVYDITDPREPEEIAHYNTPGMANRLTVANGFIYLADQTNFGIYKHRSAEPTLLSWPDNLEFGEVPAGDQSQLIVSISNWGFRNLLLYNIYTHDEPFSVDFEELIIVETDSTCEVTITFAPLEPSEYDGTVTIISNDPDRQASRIAVYGTGIEPVEAEREAKSSVPDRFTLSAIRPNPFNSVATIRFGLPESAEISLQVYDLTGRQAAGILDRKLSAGWHSVAWNAAEMPTGQYFIRLATPENSLVQKVMLVR